MIEQSIYSRADGVHINANGQTIQSGYGRMAYTSGYPGLGGIPDQYIAGYGNAMPDAMGKLPAVFSMFELETDAGIAHVLQLNIPPVQGDAGSAHIAHQYVAVEDASIAAMIRNPLDWMQIYYQNERNMPIRRVLQSSDKLRPEIRFNPGLLVQVLQYFGMSWRTFELLLSSIFISINSATTATIVLVDDARSDYEAWIRRLIVHIYFFMPFEMRRRAGFESWCTGRLYNGSVNLCFASKRALMHRGERYYLMLDTRGERTFDVTEMPVFIGNNYMFKGTASDQDFQSDNSYSQFIRPWLRAALDMQNGLQAEAVLNVRYWEAFDIMPAGRSVPSLAGFAKLIEFQQMYEGGKLPAPSEFANFAGPFCEATGKLGCKLFLQRLKQSIDSYEVNEKLIDDLLVLVDSEKFGRDLSNFVIDRLKNHFSTVCVGLEKLVTLMKAASDLDVKSASLIALADHARSSGDGWKDAKLFCEILSVPTLEDAVKAHISELSLNTVPVQFAPSEETHSVLKQYLELGEASYRDAYVCKYLESAEVESKWMRSEMGEILSKCVDPNVERNCYMAVRRFLNGEKIIFSIDETMELLTKIDDEFSNADYRAELFARCLDCMERFDIASENCIAQIERTYERLEKMIAGYGFDVRNAAIKWVLDNGCLPMVRRITMASVLIETPFESKALNLFLDGQMREKKALPEIAELLNVYPELKFTGAQKAKCREIVLGALMQDDLTLTMQNSEEIILNICLDFEPQDAEKLCIECIHRIESVQDAGIMYMHKMCAFVDRLRGLIGEYAFSNAAVEAVIEWVLGNEDVRISDRLDMVSRAFLRPYDSEALNVFLTDVNRLKQINISEAGSLMRLYGRARFTQKQKDALLRLIASALEELCSDIEEIADVFDTLSAMPEDARDSCALALLRGMMAGDLSQSFKMIAKLMMCARLGAPVRESAKDAFAQLPVSVPELRYLIRVSAFYSDNAEQFECAWQDANDRLRINKTQVGDLLKMLTEDKNLIYGLQGSYSEAFKFMLTRELSRFDYSAGEACKIAIVLMTACGAEAAPMTEAILQKADADDAEAVAEYLIQAANVPDLLNDLIMKEAVRMMKHGKVANTTLAKLFEHCENNKIPMNEEAALCLAELIGNLDCPVMNGLEILRRFENMKGFAGVPAKTAAELFVEQNEIRLENVLEYRVKTADTNSELTAEVLRLLLNKLGEVKEELSGKQLGELLIGMPEKERALEAYRRLMDGGCVLSIDDFAERLHAEAFAEADECLALALKVYSCPKAKIGIANKMDELESIFKWDDLMQNWRETDKALNAKTREILNAVKLRDLIDLAEEKRTHGLQVMIKDVLEEKAELLETKVKEGAEINFVFLWTYFGTGNADAPGDDIPEAICRLEKIYRDEPERVGGIIALIACVRYVNFINPFEALTTAMRVAYDRSQIMEWNTPIKWKMEMKETAEALVADERFAMPNVPDLYEPFVNLVAYAQANGLEMTDTVFTKTLRLVYDRGFRDFRQNRQDLLADYVNSGAEEIKPLAFKMYREVTLNKMYESSRAKRVIDFNRFKSYCWDKLKDKELAVRLIASIVVGLKKKKVALELKEAIYCCCEWWSQKACPDNEFTWICVTFVEMINEQLQDPERIKSIDQVADVYRSSMLEKLLYLDIMLPIFKAFIGKSNESAATAMFKAVWRYKKDYSSYSAELKNEGFDISQHPEVLLDAKVWNSICEAAENASEMETEYLQWRVYIVIKHTELWLRIPKWEKQVMRLLRINCMEDALTGFYALSQKANPQIRNYLLSNFYYICKCYVQLVREGYVNYRIIYPDVDLRKPSDFTKDNQIAEFVVFIAQIYASSRRREEKCRKLVDEYKGLIPTRQYNEFTQMWSAFGHALNL